ncbi:MAG TPA: Maf family protein [Syntrophomonas sp.]|nr:Maf family protein [Syntrophomonas sp.]
MQKIILASASPRRQQLFAQIGLPFVAAAADVDEEPMKECSAPELVQQLARRKAEQVAGVWRDAIIIAADTLVILDEHIMGKPVNREDAFRKLSLLSGRHHKVMTGLCVLDSNRGICDTGVESTEVYFRTLTPGEINAYLNWGEWVDKAGGYGIQGKGALLIEKIEGCYFNVVGLPINRLYIMLGKQGVNLLGGKTPDGLPVWDQGHAPGDASPGKT